MKFLKRFVNIIRAILWPIDDPAIVWGGDLNEIEGIDYCWLSSLVIILSV